MPAFVRLANSRVPHLGPESPGNVEEFSHGELSTDLRSCVGFGALVLGAPDSVHAVDSIQAPSLNRAGAASRTRRRIGLSSSRRARQMRTSTAAVGKAGTIAGTYGFANPIRSYPPSCLADNLPQFASGSDPNAQQLQLITPIFDPVTNKYDLTDLYTVWRVPCSGGFSAVLLEIDRPSGSQNNGSVYPIFPSSVRVQRQRLTYPKVTQRSEYVVFGYCRSARFTMTLTSTSWKSTGRQPTRPQLQPGVRAEISTRLRQRRNATSPAPSMFRPTIRPASTIILRFNPWK